MTVYLKQATASQEILIGMMISSTDGITPATGLTVANTDIQIWKAGATSMANKNSGGATEIGTTGYYYATLDATDTATLGSLIINVNVAGALMWRGEFAVLAAETYDAWFGTAHLATAAELAKVPKSDSTVTWNATALASIQTEANDALVANNLDHLLLTPVNEDMTSQCADGSIFGRFLTGGDTSEFISTDSIIDIHAAIVALAADVGDAGLGNSLVSKVDDIKTEMDKVPKSDSNVTWNSTALGSIQSEATDALNAYDPPTNAEMEARTLAAASYFDPAADVVAHVTLVDTCTTNTDMRGTNSAALASVCTEGRLAELDAANLPSSIDDVYDDVGGVKSVVDLILVDTGTTIPGTITALDALIDRVLGLNHENFRITSPVFDSGNMTSCTVKIYPTATDCTNDTNVLATYTITATYDVGGNLATYKSVKA